jgi:predicted metalloprotease with PDZ domain
MPPRRVNPAFLVTLPIAALAWACVALAAPPITMEVDAREAPIRMLHTRIVLPATPGPLTLYYPKWIPGEHGPNGPVQGIAGLKFSAGGKPVAWQRDDVDMFAFHLDVPAGAKTIEAAFDFLPPAPETRYSGGASATANLVVLNWNQLLLYPAGGTSDGWTYTLRLRLPAGWKYGTALPVAQDAGDRVDFLPVSLTRLVDSPLVAGSYFRRIPLTPSSVPAHFIDMVADSREALEMPPDLVAGYQRLVAEAAALFGAQHYQRYHFLYTLSDQVAHFGLEHHESSDNRVFERTLTDPQLRRVSTGLLPHEFVHSWNGKYRRPDGLATPDYQQPMKGELLWVYEGLTSYLGWVLQGRTGLLTPSSWHQQLAQTAAYLDQRPGRTWRPLLDTAVGAQLLPGTPPEWQEWRRGNDYYNEAVLIWLDADVTIRQLTKGERSLDDFCRKFHGGESGPPAIVPYSYDEVVRTLDEVAPYDWRAFLDARVSAIAPRAPLGGITNGGWKLVYGDSVPAYYAAGEQARKLSDERFTIGLLLGEGGAITDVVPGMAAAKAGVAPGMKLIAVNGRALAKDVLRDAIRATRTYNQPLELLVENGVNYKTCKLDYKGGGRYPDLERDASKPDVLGDIAKARATGP